MRASLITFLPFFFNDTATTEIYTLSLHDALPIFPLRGHRRARAAQRRSAHRPADPERLLHLPSRGALRDRKSTRLNSSHSQISYAVFCLKKKINAYVLKFEINRRITIRDYT